MEISLEPKKRYLKVDDFKVGQTLTGQIVADGYWVEGLYQGEKTNTWYIPCKVNDQEVLVKMNKTAREEAAKTFEERFSEKWVGKQLMIVVIPSSKAKSGKSYAVSPIAWSE